MMSPVHGSAVLQAFPLTIVRTPLLPSKTFIEWSESYGPIGTMQDYKASICSLREQLKGFVRQQDFLEAIYIASSSLHERTTQWLASGAQNDLKIDIALVKYFARMAFRCTPFGLFSGISWGSGTGATQLRLPPRSAYRKGARLDFGFLSALSHRLSRDSTLYPALTFRPNPTLILHSGKWRYIEADSSSDRRKFHLSTLVSDATLNALLGAFGALPVSYDELITLISDAAPDTDLSDIAAYVGDLVANQVILTSLEPPLTGGDALGVVAAALEGCSAGESHRADIQEVRALLNVVNAASIGTSTRPYEQLKAAARRVTEGVEHFYQVDLVKPADAISISQSVTDDVAKTVEKLLSITVLETQAQKHLREFREEFERRYERREVPLLEALDPDCGIGFGDQARDVTPLLDGLPFQGSFPATTWHLSAAHEFLLRKLQDALTRNLPEVVLTDDELTGLSTAPSGAKIPDSLCAVVTLLARSTDDVDSGNYSYLLHSIDGPSGAKWIGRFCYLDEALTESVRTYLRQEETAHPDAIFVEVVHLPEGRLGNVLVRPLLRAWELPISGRSGAPPDCQLPLADIMLSVRAGSVYLRSKRLNRQVIPRHTTTHNFYYRSVGVYTFLCALQQQGISSTKLGWPDLIIQTATKLPRLRYGKCVLFPASWFVESAEIQRLARMEAFERYREVQRLREEKGLPRWVAVVIGASSLPIDLQNPLGVECLVSELKDRGRAWLIEVVPESTNGAVQGPEGLYQHELVIPYTRRLPSQSTQRPPESMTVAANGPASGNTPARVFPPGSEWCFLELYAAPSLHDEILIHVISPQTRSLLNSRVIDSWFFIRYEDPTPHLRLRLHSRSNAEAKLAADLLCSSFAPLVERGQISRVVINTYHREVERYGGVHGIALSEQLFFCDSEYCLELLQLQSDNGAFGAAPYRWKAALMGMYSLMLDFGLDQPAMLEFLNNHTRRAANRYAASKQAKVALDRKFRDLRGELEKLLGEDNTIAQDVRSVREILRSRSLRLAEPVRHLAALEAKGWLNQGMTDILGSVLHMHANRVLCTATNPQEFVLYELLKRHCASSQARVSDAARIARLRGSSGPVDAS